LASREPASNLPLLNPEKECYLKSRHARTACVYPVHVGHSLRNTNRLTLVPLKGETDEPCSENVYRRSNGTPTLPDFIVHTENSNLSKGDFMKLQKKIIWISLLILLSLGMGQAIAEPIEVTGLVPARELSDDSGLKPGLLPIYIYKLLKSADDIPKLDVKTTKEKVGNPILFLNHSWGKKDLIFDSGVSQSLGIQMNGFLKFSKAGKYSLKAKSNDGIAVLICDKRTVWQPGIQTDHF
jgi:hypothetical protein